ncbi:HpcH/HpaI aldolase family protein [Pandoraea anhela]|uniref:HpcH/HpaI aldolase family protein n=1 Tax=Pandoraea anhela TaxID=2508295 RepID=UPI001FE8DAF1|nr:HpcH/HpaI aldolase/citrate lyase family protein [Pandoraea anhela]
MNTPTSDNRGPHANDFLAALEAKWRTEIGLWCSLGSPVTTEICAGAGYDWLLLDMEHAPNELRDIYAQLQAAAPYPVSCIVRPDANDPVKIKRLMDIGVKSFLIPFVESASDAERAVRATRYPPHGVRGLTLSSRANRFGRDKHYLSRIQDDVCVIVQIETRKAIEALDDICAVEGVDAVFIGPSDLSADLGYLGEPGAPEPVALIRKVIDRLTARAIPWGILAPVESDARMYCELGAAFVAVGSDQSRLVAGVDALARQFD